MHSHRLVGLVVKASASRVEDPGFESRLRRDFFGVESYQWLQNWHSSGCAWRYRVSTGTGRPGVSILWLGEVESLICSFYLNVAARKMTEQIRPWETLACCWDVKQQTNKLVHSLAGWCRADPTTRTGSLASGHCSLVFPPPPPPPSSFSLFSFGLGLDTDRCIESFKWSSFHWRLCSCLYRVSSLMRTVDGHCGRAIMPETGQWTFYRRVLQPGATLSVLPDSSRAVLFIPAARQPFHLSPRLCPSTAGCSLHQCLPLSSVCCFPVSPFT